MASKSISWKDRILLVNDGPPPADLSQPLTEGEIRILQSYLPILGCFGDLTGVEAREIVNGRWDERTQNAVARFARDYGADYPFPVDGDTQGTLWAVRREALARIQQLNVGVAPSGTYARHFSHDMKGLATAFAAASIPEEWRPKLRTLHPALRFPALEVLRELKEKHHLDVVIKETYRNPGTQEALVAKGVSLAPHGYSFHNYGLAIDVKPQPESEENWATVQRVFEEFGFYSLQLHQGWDPPHMELPAKTQDMMKWPQAKEGWKIVPQDHIPARWTEINNRVLAAHREAAPSPTAILDGTQPEAGKGASIRW